MKLRQALARIGGAFREAFRKVFTAWSALALAFLFGLAWLRVLDPIAVETLRVKTFDQYQRWLPRDRAEAPVVIIDIDEESLTEHGQWPWPRTLIAELLDQAFAQGAFAMALDMVFPEPDRLSPGAFAEAMPGLPEATRAALAATPSNDSRLARVIANRPIVVGRVASQKPAGMAAYETPPSSSVAKIGQTGGRDPYDHLPTFPALVTNVADIEKVANARGVFTLAKEIDGVVRRPPLLIIAADKPHPVLSVELIRYIAGQKTLLVRTNDAGVEEINAGGVAIPTDAVGRMWVYYGEYDPERYVSASDVLAGKAADRLAGKLVFLGTSAEGLKDIRSMPVVGQAAGVEVHAQAVETILQGKFLQRPWYADVLEIFIIILGGLALIVQVPLLGAVWTLTLFVAVMGSMIGASWWAFTEKGLLIDPLYPAIALFLTYGLLSFGNYLREEAQKQRIRAAFNMYLSPDMVARLANDPERLTLGGENREITVLFSDVQGFTSISEKYDAVGLTRLINRILTPLTDAILERNGCIDKYMGDAIMAFWNAPLDDKQHARNACGAALEMLDRLNRVNAEMAAEGASDELKVGIGLNTTQASVGNMGSEQRFDYTALGDGVNLGSRLEGQTRTYGVDVIMGEATRDAVSGPGGPAVLELDQIRVKGKKEPARIFALMGDERLAARSEWTALESAQNALLAAYRAQDWAAARAELSACAEAAEKAGLSLLPEADPAPDAPPLPALWAVYRDRIADYEADPPGADWDGVYTMTSK